MTADPVNIAVGVLTYRRPDQLRRALPAVLEHARAHAAESGDVVRVHVVDNDPAGSAAGFVHSLAAPDLRYVVEPAPGIANARNRALLETVDCDLLVFFDDDEQPEPGWLPALVDTWRATGAAAVMGRVLSTFAEPPDPWIEAGRFFRRRRMPTGTPIPAAATANLLLDLAQLRAAGVAFDPQLGLSGGEDTLLSRRLVAAGRLIVWCDESVVLDVVPAARATRRWVLGRAWSHGNTTTRVDLRMAGSPGRAAVARARALAGGSARLAGGGLRFGWGILSRSLVHQARGARAVYRGAGMVAAACGHVHYEYARPAAA